MRRSKQIILISAALLAAFWPCARGNDSAASTALGGIQLRREPRIAMLKERLTISTQKVTVEYEFFNDSDQDIATEVAFPIPPYEAPREDTGGSRAFNDFRLWVDGREANFQTEAKAKLGSADYTSLLKSLDVDIASFGHLDDRAEKPVVPDVQKLSEKERKRLDEAGLTDEDQWPLWTVEKIYHWHQIFPAHKVLHVRHEYKPVVGFTPVETKFIDSAERKKQVVEARKMEESAWTIDEAAQIDNACVDPGLEKLLVAANQIDPGPRGSYDKGYVRMVWVDYILTTANNWKTPIKDFELVVEKPIVEGGLWYVSFCWDGPVKRIDASRFRARVRNFVPKKELHIAFFRVH